VLLCTALALTTAACGGNDAAAGGDEAGLVVYSGRNENLIKPLLDQFTEQTGIALRPRFGDSAALAATLLEEGDGTPAEVFLSQDAGALGALQDEGRLAPLAQEQLDRVPADYRSRDGRWLGVSGRARVLAYDSEQVPEAQLPTSVFQLTDPAYRGKVGFAPTNASFQSFVTGMRVTVGDDRARQWLQDMKDNDIRAYEGNVAVLDAVERGEIPFGLVNHYYLYEKAASTQGGLDALRARNHLFAPGDPGALVNVAGVGVLEGQADEETAALVDFLLSTTAQEYFARVTKEFPLVAGVQPDVPGLPALDALQGPDVDLSQLDTLQETLAMLQEVGLV
jgi:iron(III) transport system substrate-binding protein